ncbi:hypothetical protein [Novosphingobium sp.]|uniref:hypothetical protein n=1 Tax=Novosphingobium sp. TaxID=1874826 RepID=UPI0027348637|nr:hypothetical protein [Novosphingobium sp.]MDP3908208.1 hypothetical protein [Novosphingobium sp.]
MASLKFQPPAPQNMASYFDDITSARIKNFNGIYRLDFKGALKAVRSRSSVAERLALLAEFSSRMENIGQQQGYLAEPPKEADAAGSIAKFIIEDGLGLKQKTVDQKIYDKGISLTKDWVKSGLNSTGQGAFRLMDVIWKILNASSATDVARILAKEGGKDLASWVSANAPTIAKRALKAGGYNSRARNQIMRTIASRIALLKAPFKLLARFQPIIFALDIFLTPTETVSDFEEQRSLFLLYFSQLHADQNSIFSEIIGKNANPAKGQLSVPLSQLLQTSISSSR